MEVSQYTYSQQVGGIDCSPVSLELTYGLERLAMYIQGVDDIYDLDWDGVPTDQGGKIYGDVYTQAELEFSTFNFEYADTEALFRQFRAAETACPMLLAADQPIPLPASDRVCRATPSSLLLHPPVVLIGPDLQP